MTPTLTLMVGLPGAGKTTLARKLAATKPAVRLTPDEWMIRLGIDGYDEVGRDRIETLHIELADALLIAGANVILDFGFWSIEERAVLRSLAYGRGADFEIQFLDAPLPVLIERLMEREARGNEKSFPVAPEDLRLWSEGFERPTPAEGRVVTNTEVPDAGAASA